MNIVFHDHLVDQLNGVPGGFRFLSYDVYDNRFHSKPVRENGIYYPMADIFNPIKGFVLSNIERPGYA